MEEIIEHYGLGALEILAITGVVKIIFSCVGVGGAISNMVANFMITICG